MIPLFPSTNRHQRGGSLIEVMVSILVLSVGLLGIGAAQMTALRNSQSSYSRMQAAALSGALLDAMRANADAARGGAYVMARTCTTRSATGNRAEADLTHWVTRVRQQLGDTTATCATVACAAATCTVTLEWDDSRGSGGSPSQTLVTVSRL